MCRACGRENSISTGVPRSVASGSSLAATRGGSAFDAAALVGRAGAPGIVFLMDRGVRKAPLARRRRLPRRGDRRAGRRWNRRRRAYAWTVPGWPSRPWKTTTWARCLMPWAAAIATNRFSWTRSSTPSGGGKTTPLFSPAAGRRDRARTATGGGQRESEGVFRVRPEIVKRIHDGLRDYVGGGGTLYASDWRFYLVAIAFPEFVEENKADARRFADRSRRGGRSGLAETARGVDQLNFDEPGCSPPLSTPRKRPPISAASI